MMSRNQFTMPKSPDRKADAEATEQIRKTRAEVIMDAIQDAEQTTGDFTCFVETDSGDLESMPILVAIRYEEARGRILSQNAEGLSIACSAAMRSKGKADFRITEDSKAAENIRSLHINPALESNAAKSLFRGIQNAHDERNFRSYITITLPGEQKAHSILLAIHIARKEGIISTTEFNFLVTYCINQMTDSGLDLDEIPSFLAEVFAANLISETELWLLLDKICPTSDARKKAIDTITSESEKFVPKRPESQDDELKISAVEIPRVRIALAASLVLAAAVTILSTVKPPTPSSNTPTPPPPAATSPEPEAAKPETGKSAPREEQSNVQPPIVPLTPPPESDETVLMNFPIFWRTDYHGKKVIDLKATLTHWKLTMDTSAVITEHGEIRVALKLEGDDKHLKGFFDPGSLKGSELSIDLLFQ